MIKLLIYIKVISNSFLYPLLLLFFLLQYPFYLFSSITKSGINFEKNYNSDQIYEKQNDSTVVTIRFLRNGIVARQKEIKLVVLASLMPM